MDESDDGPASPVAADGLRSVAASPVAAVAAAAVTARVSPAAAPARPPPRILFAGDRKQARERRNKRFNLQQSSLYALAFAPPDSGCELLCAASSLGSIFLWRIADIAQHLTSTSARRTPLGECAIFPAGESVYALATTPTHLLASGDAGISAVSWASLAAGVGAAAAAAASATTAGDDDTPTGPAAARSGIRGCYAVEATTSWQHLNHSSAASSAPAFETNGMACDPATGSLYTATGDGNAYCWDLETGRQKTVLRGHTGYLHDITVLPATHRVATASEDGTVRLWDPRERRSVATLAPPETAMGRTSGKWMSCVAVDAGEDWLVCGGGPPLSLWHLRSCTYTNSLDAAGSSLPALYHPNTVHFGDDEIVAGGSAPCVQHWSPNGELRYATQVAVSSIYAVASSPAASLTAVSGLGPAIDMLANPRVRAFSLSLLDSDTE